MASLQQDIERMDIEALEFFFNAVNRLFVIFGEDGRIRRANLAFRRFTGPAGASDDVSMEALLQPESVGLFKDAIAGLRSGRQVEEATLEFRIGREKLKVDATLMRSETNEIYFSAKDVTQQKEAKLSREVAETNLANLEGVLGLGVWRMEGMRITQWSNGMHRLFGTDVGEGVPKWKNLSDMLVQDEYDNVDRAFKACLLKGVPLQLCYSILSPSGDPRRVEVIGSPIIDEAGKVTGAHGVAIDRTDNFNALQKLMNSESITRQLLEHAPLAIVILDTDQRVSMVSRRWLEDLGFEQKDVLGRRLNQIFETFPPSLQRDLKLAFSGKVARTSNVEFKGAKASFSVDWTISPWFDGDSLGGVVCTHFNVTEQVPLQNEKASASADAWLDHELLRCATWSTDLRARSHQVNGAWKHLLGETPTVEFFPKKFMGMVAPEDKERVLIAWRKHVGQGEAFRLSHGLIATDGRKLTVESAVKLIRHGESGSPMQILGAITQIPESKLDAGRPTIRETEPKIRILPMDSQLREVESETPVLFERGSEDVRRINILVAEDNPINRRIVSTVLNALDIDLEFAENGLEAVEAAKNTRFDAILMDLNMPVMNGLVATQEIRAAEGRREDLPRIPIFALSAMENVPDEELMGPKGFTAFLRKPLQLEQFCELLNHYVIASRIDDPNCAA